MDKSPDLSRRRFIAGSLLAGAAFVTAPTLWACTRQVGAGMPRLLDGWNQPRQLASVDGLLDVTLVARPYEWTGLGVASAMQSLGEGIPSPTWRINPGDRIRVTLRNELPDQPTNLHPHGLHVSPVAPSDDVFLDIQPGQEFTYEYQTLDDHPPGMYWYHPHRHHYATIQVAKGMLGALIVDGLEKKVPELADVPQAVVAFQGLWFDNGQVQHTAEGWVMKGTETLVTNGLTSPSMPIESGQPVWLQLLNASPMSYAKFGIEGHELNVIAVDGNPLPRTRTATEWFLPPGARADVVVVAGSAGRYQAGTIPAPEWSGDGDPPNANGGSWYRRHINGITLNALPGFTFDVRDSTQQRFAMPTALTSDYFTDLSGVAVTGTKQRAVITIVGKDLGFNNQVFNAQIDAFTSQVGTVDEWLFINRTTVPHPIHIHVNPVQVISVNGVATGENFYRDTFTVPGYSRVVVRTKYEDFAGKTVLHCHNLDHEDNGLMATLKINSEPGQPVPTPSYPTPSGLSIHAPQH